MASEPAVHFLGSSMRVLKATYYAYFDCHNNHVTTSSYCFHQAVSPMPATASQKLRTVGMSEAP